MDWNLIKHIYFRTKKQHGMILLTMLSFMLGYILIQIKPVYIKQLIDSALGNEPIMKYVLYIGLVLIGSNILFRIFDASIMYSQKEIMKELYEYSLKKLMQHSYSFFTDNFSGGLVAKSKRYANSFEAIQDIFVFNIFNAIISICVVTIVLYFQNRILSLGFLVWAVIYAIVSISLSKKQQEYAQEYAQEDSKTTGRLSDIITNMLTVKMFAKEKKEHEEYKQQTNRQISALWKEWKYSFKVLFVQSILLGLLEFFTLLFTVKGYQAGTISLGTIVLVQMYALLVFSSVWNLGRGVQKMTKKLSEMKEMVDIIELPPEIVDAKKITTKNITKGEIEFKNITFQYDKQSLIHNFNLKIKQGEKIGLVGMSGSGKTTITKLILRFFDVQKGKITIDGINIKTMSQSKLRQAITYVPQEPTLFHRSIKENIAYAKTTTEKELKQAIKKAHADLFIKHLPLKEKTLVGERGIKLSGGERQRVAIARAFLKQAPIILMDEATSSLDTISEQYIKKSMKELLKNKTAIIIAHRLSTIKELDRIIVLEKGKIVEEGKHKELLKNKGAYYKLYENQQI